MSKIIRILSNYDERKEHFRSYARFRCLQNFLPKQIKVNADFDLYVVSEATKEEAIYCRAIISQLAYCETAEQLVSALAEYDIHIQ